ncbi:LOW QUALITY PROTEIN: hypothetical protein U9M48_036183, partial [Paspalum notatum var. saurae]
VYGGLPHTLSDDSGLHDRVQEKKACWHTRHQPSRISPEPLFIADLRTLASVADPSHPVDINMILRSKSQAIITFWLRVPFLFRNGAALSEDIDIVTMFGRGSPKLNLMLSKASQRKNSPKVQPTKDNGSTSSEKTRAAWNPALEKTLVDLLHEHNIPEYRGQNGWSSEAWNKIVKEFHEKDSVTNEKTKWSFFRSQMLRGFARSLFLCLKHRESFIMVSNTAEGTYNFTSTQLHNSPEMIPDESERFGVMPINLEERTYPRQDEEKTMMMMMKQICQEGMLLNKEPTNEDEGTKLPRKASAVTRNKDPKESKRQKKSSNIEAIMEKDVDIKAKQIETKEKKDAQANDFSIKRCISILNTMDVTKEEKVKAFSVFKNLDSREIFLSASEEDLEFAMMWLRNEM